MVNDRWYIMDPLYDHTPWDPLYDHTALGPLYDHTPAWECVTMYENVCSRLIFRG